MTASAFKRGGGAKYTCDGHTQLYLHWESSQGKSSGESAHKSGGQKQAASTPAPPAPGLAARVQSLLAEVAGKGKGPTR